MVSNRNGMKDLSQYILFLVEGCEVPVDVKLQEDGSYNIVITKDLKGSSVLYKMAIERSETNIKFVRNQLKKYLSSLNVNVFVVYLNYPTNYREIKMYYEYKLS